MAFRKLRTPIRTGDICIAKSIFAFQSVLCNLSLVSVLEKPMVFAKARKEMQAVSWNW